MKAKYFLPAILALVLVSGILFSSCPNPASNDDDDDEVNSKLYEMVMSLGYSPAFTWETPVRLDWDPVPAEVAANDTAYGPAVTYPNATGHLQGMVRVKDGTFWASTVYVTTSPWTNTPTGEEAALGMDRGTGAGVGYLVNFNAQGEEIKRVKVGEGTIYHPGGIDYDGTYIWVPVAEYRPNSYSMIYRVDPEASPESAATKVLERVEDHVGGILHDKKNKTLIGNTWGSRRFYTWPLKDNGTVSQTVWTRAQLAEIKVLNRSAYIDYQDNMYVDNGKMIASGLSGDVGGIEVLDCKTGLIENQIRILTKVDQGSSVTTGGRPLCQNPFWLEVSPDESKIIAYFAPEDDSTYLYIYSVAPGNHPNASIVYK
jgi:hypothetical protein